MGEHVRLFYGDSESRPDMFYLGDFLAPDPFWVLVCGEKRIAVLNALEQHRAAETSKFSEVLGLESCLRDAIEPRGASESVRLVRFLAERYGVEVFCVPEWFPAGLFVELQKQGLPVVVAEGSSVPERLVKSEREAELLRQANAASAAGLAAAEETLRRATVRRGKLYFRGKVLTSECLIQRIEDACWKAGALASRTIAAGGDQACDPHQQGSGPLYANSLIVVDVFPKMRASGYFGDMSRTFIKGTPSDAQGQLLKTVLEAQKVAFSALQANVSGADIHKKVQEFFVSRGYLTERRGGQNVGFFHGTGHGLGLEIHEAPRLGARGGELPCHTVVTVEPGLYYPGLGGVRFEDVAWIQERGACWLSSYPSVPVL